MINTPTKITDAQLKPLGVTGVVCGQNAQKNAQAEYVTAAVLIGTPSLPSENCDSGRVCG